MAMKLEQRIERKQAQDADGSIIEALDVFSGNGRSDDFANESSPPIANDLQRPSVGHEPLMFRAIVSKRAIKNRSKCIHDRFSRGTKVQDEALCFETRKQELTRGFRTDLPPC